jgi:conjugal transfer pilus assembly protein TraV
MSLSTARIGTVAATLASLLLSACANITGLDGASSYTCKAPEGVKCDSVSGTYHNALQNNLPSQRRAPTGGQSQLPPAPNPAGMRNAPAMLATAARTAPSEEAAGYAAAPLRASPKILRLWIKSWEDADRDLNGETLVYVQVDNGRWLVDHVQRQSRESYAPVRPGKPVASGKGAGGDPARPSANPASADDTTSITQTLRALQGRVASPSDN